MVATRWYCLKFFRVQAGYLGDDEEEEEEEGGEEEGQPKNSPEEVVATMGNVISLFLRMQDLRLAR